MNSEMSSSSAVTFSKLLSFPISNNFRKKSSGVSASVCLVQKNSPRLWYVFLFGRKYSLNNRSKPLIAILSSSVLYSDLVLLYRASGLIPHTKSSYIWFSFVVLRFVTFLLPGLIPQCPLYISVLYIAGISQAIVSGKDFLSVCCCFKVRHFELCCFLCHCFFVSVKLR